MEELIVRDIYIKLYEKDKHVKDIFIKSDNF